MHVAFKPSPPQFAITSILTRKLATPIVLATTLLLGGVSFGTLASETATSPQSSAAYEPKVGQAGKDVVWVPTPQALVDAMLDLAKATRQDYLVDLGSGDGRTVITAAKRGMTAHGIEYNPDMVELARRNAAAAGVEKQATFAAADIFETDFSKADIVTMFLLPSLNAKLIPTLLEMEPGTRLVSNSFRMGDWEPDQSVRVEEGCTSWCTAHLWIVPAKVAGVWKLGSDSLQLEQTHQMLTGKLGNAEISGGKLLGNAITFTADGKQYEGTVNGAAMTGTLKGSGGSWNARRQ